MRIHRTRVNFRGEKVLEKDTLNQYLDYCTEPDSFSNNGTVERVQHRLDKTKAILAGLIDVLMTKGLLTEAEFKSCLPWGCDTEIVEITKEE